MINARSIATIGIGFGVVAITTIGFIGNETIPPITPEQPPYVINIAAGGTTARRVDYTPDRTINNDDNDIIMLVVMAFMETRKWEV